MKAIITIAFIGVLIAACNKEPAHKFDPIFIGTWSHIENDNESWYVDIGSDSYGSVLLYDSLGEFITAYGENPKRWRIKEVTNQLCHGLYNKKFHIDQYPEIAQQTIINGFDTIAPGETYMILDGDYFVE